eukprot:5983303-Prymnesium_polylepis.2
MGTTVEAADAEAFAGAECHAGPTSCAASPCAALSPMPGSASAKQAWMGAARGSAELARELGHETLS